MATADQLARMGADQLSLLRFNAEGAGDRDTLKLIAAEYRARRKAHRESGGAYSPGPRVTDE